MGIVQENMANKPMPEVQQTEHGVTYVKAATETPIEAVEAAVEKVEPAPVEPSAEKVAEKKKKGGRPKKSDKKKK